MKGVYTIQFDVKRTESSGKSVVAGGYFFNFSRIKNFIFIKKKSILSNNVKTIIVTKTSFKLNCLNIVYVKLKKHLKYFIYLFLNLLLIYL